MKKERTKVPPYLQWLNNYRVASAWIAKHDVERTVDANGGLVRIESFLPEFVAEGILSVVEAVPDEAWNDTSAKEDYTQNNISHSFASVKQAEGLDAVTRLFSLVRPGALNAFSAARYCRTDHIAPHDDRAYTQVRLDNGRVITTSRSLAVIYYLTRDWRDSYGGALLDLEDPAAPPGQPTRYVPKWNSVVAFRVPRYHAVTPMTTNRPRYSIFGWFLVPGKLYPLYTGEEQQAQQVQRLKQVKGQQQQGLGQPQGQGQQQEQRQGQEQGGKEGGGAGKRKREGVTDRRQQQQQGPETERQRQEGSSAHAAPAPAAAQPRKRRRQDGQNGALAAAAAGRQAEEGPSGRCAEACGGARDSEACAGPRCRGKELRALHERRRAEAEAPGAASGVDSARGKGAPCNGHTTSHKRAGPGPGSEDRKGGPPSRRKGRKAAAGRTAAATAAEGAEAKARVGEAGGGRADGAEPGGRSERGRRVRLPGRWQGRRKHVPVFVG